MKTDLTVAICVYNGEKYIGETLRCIMAQSYQEFNLLIVDDCSTDGTRALVERFFRENPRQYELMSLPENGGLNYARHFVENYARTKYIIQTDADDLPYPTMVEKLYHKITSDPDLMVVSCYSEYIDEKGRKIGGGIRMGAPTKEEFYDRAERKKLMFMSVSVVYDRDASLEVGGIKIDGYPEGKPRYQDYCEDLDHWTRMSDLYVKGRAIVTIPEVLYGYRKRAGALSASTLNMNIKIKYIKANLLRRRAGERELSFIEFYNSLSSEQMRTMRRSSAVADSLREGVMRIKRGRVFTGAFYVAKSIMMDPKYFWQKIKANSGLIK